MMIGIMEMIRSSSDGIQNQLLDIRSKNLFSLSFSSNSDRAVVIKSSDSPFMNRSMPLIDIDTRWSVMRSYTTLAETRRCSDYV